MISPLAHIHPAAQIGNNVKIDPFAVIEEGVLIGEGTHVMSHAVIMKNTIVGKILRYFSGSSFGSHSPGFKI